MFAYQAILDDLILHIVSLTFTESVLVIDRIYYEISLQASNGQIPNMSAGSLSPGSCRDHTSRLSPRRIDSLRSRYSNISMTRMKRSILRERGTNRIVTRRKQVATRTNLRGDHLKTENFVNLADQSGNLQEADLEKIAGHKFEKTKGGAVTKISHNK